MRTRREGLTLLATTLIAVWAGFGSTGTPAQDLRLDHTNPEHLKPRTLPHQTPYLRPLWPGREHSYLVYNFPKPLETLTVPDNALSRLCRLGAFGQPQFGGRLFARSPERVYGVGAADGRTLHDPQTKAKTGYIYFFRDADTSRCQVLVAPEGKVAPYAVTPQTP
ncbi:Secreted protein [uncultured Gammaproteobacteria bacterium]